MIKFKLLRQAIVAAKKSPNFGDVAILKAEALGGRINPAIAHKMQPVVGYHPRINLLRLSQLPEGTLGREYARHMQLSHLRPLEISPELENIARDNVFALRYLVTHDIFHVLLGLDTSYAGEIGVLAFAVEQEYCHRQKIALAIAKIIYPILAPNQIKEIFANVRKGKELGKKADFLLSYRFESNWHEPLTKIRQELGLS